MDRGATSRYDQANGDSESDRLGHDRAGHGRFSPHYLTCSGTVAPGNPARMRLVPSFIARPVKHRLRCRSC